MDDITRFIPDATPEQIASAKRGDEAGQRITREIWGDRQPPYWCSRYYVLDDNNTACPVGLGTWGVWFEHEAEKIRAGKPSRRIIGRTEIGRYLVSTMFLGMDHSYGMTDHRQLFETRVYRCRTSWGSALEDGTRGIAEDYLERYATYPQAIAGHDEAVQWARIERVLDTTDDFERSRKTRKVASARRPRPA
jgi:hypothetical protein